MFLLLVQAVGERSGSSYLAIQISDMPLLGAAVRAGKRHRDDEDEEKRRRRAPPPPKTVRPEHSMIDDSDSSESEDENLFPSVDHYNNALFVLVHCLFHCSSLLFW